MDVSDTELDVSKTKQDENLDKIESGMEDITDDEDDNDDEEGEEGEEEDDDDDNSEDGDDDEEDADDDDEEENEDEDNMLEVSDSDSDDVEKCPICLNRFKDQDVGTPESCDHMFCLECIQEWAKNVNTCPSDRQVFKLILCRHGVDDVIYKKISVEDKNVMEDVEEVEEEPTYCEVCKECNREDRLLLCDGCDRGYHLDCLTPPLSTVPVEEWFCPACARREDIVQEVEEESAPGGRHRWRRQIPRTLVMERVRSAIEEIRVRRTRNLTRLIASDEDEPMDVEEPSAVTPSTSSPAKRSPRKRKTPAKRKTKRKYKKRKTKRKTTTTAKKTPTKKTTKRRRKTRKRKGKKVKRLARTARPSPATSVKTRIAGALGISNPPKGRTIPVQKSKQEVSIDSKRSEIGGTSFSVFGDRDQLNYFADEQTEAATSSEQSAGPRKYSRLAMSSYGPIGRVPKVSAAKQKKKMTTPEVVESGSALDLLGTIMQDQTKLAMSSKNVTIQRDGSLTARPSSPDQPKKSDKSTPSLFKSSFETVDKKVENTPSVLESLSSEKDKSSTPTEDLEEEYDPAHPTDDIDDDVDKSADKSEDVYDPAHPTDDVSDVSSEEEITVQNTNTAVHKTETDKLSKDFDKSSSAARQTKVDNTVCNESSGNSDAVIAEKSNASVKNFENISISITNEKCETKDKTESAICTEKTSEKDKNKSATKSVSPSATSSNQAAQLQQSPTKLLSPGSNRETTLKTSPCVKITETKKSPSGVKPFEISRKTLFEKRRLYGGEVDFSEDVDFSEGAFPETFELSMKRIEEVFKDTKSANDSKVGEKDQTVPTAEIDLSIVKVEPVDKSVSKNVVNIDKDKIVVKHVTVKEEKQKGKTGKDSGDKSKLPAKFKPIDTNKDNADNSGTTKLSVSDRFKMIDKTCKTPETTHFDEEDPIHEMRKLDKELDLEFGNAEFAKKKERGKELKKNKRKVSLDDSDADALRYRRESRENRDKKKSDSGEYKYAYEEKEEGEVDEEYKMKDKKKKDKKKKKSDKHFDNEEKEESEIDRRIVIQVSQNTEDRTVWEEAERQRRKRDREERRKDKYNRDIDGKKDRKSKRMRSRSRSHDRKRSRSKDRKRSRSRDRDRGRKKRRDRSKSRSRSREWSYERSRKKKKRDRKHSRDRDISRDWSRERSHEREWSWEKEWSPEKGRERNRSRDKSRERIRGRKRSRDQSDDKVDMFGRSRSPFTRKGFVKTKQVASHRPKVKPFRSDEVIEILDSSPPKKQKYDEVSSSESEKMSPERVNEEVQKISTIEVKSSGPREGNTIEHDEKEDEFDDEPEETEQFQYTDREEFTGQNRGKQMRQNLITLGVGNSDYDPANPTDSASPAAPPLPEPLQAPTPPLPPTGDFAQFPPPPPGPPPQGPPPGSVIIQDHTSLHVPPPGGQAPGQGILGEAPLLLQGPPPIETGPPPGIIQQRPALSLPVNINVLPPGFHRGLPPTISPQRQLIVSPLRGAPPRVQRLPGGNVNRFGWQVTTSSDVHPSQFGTLIPSPARLPGHPIVNGPFEGQPTHSEASHNLPPGRPPFPPHSMAPGEPRPLISIKTDTPPPGMVQFQVDKGPRSHLRPPGPGDPQQLIHIGPDPRAPPPRLPIPLLPPSSDLPPISAMVSIPPPNSSLLSRPPPDISNRVSQSFNRPGTPPDSVSTILGLARMGAGSVSGSSSMIPGLSTVNGNHNKKTMNSNGEIGKVAGTLNQLEKIGELLKQNSNKSNSGGGFGSAKDIFKVPVVPPGKSGGKADVETTEVIDMDMGSPINEEGNIELPVSPQFDNLIDNPEDLLEEDFNKKMQKVVEKELKKESSNSKEKPKEKEKSKEKSSTPTKNKAINDLKDDESKKDSPRKSKEEKQKRSKENKPEKSGHRSRRHHHHKKHDGDKDLKKKALKDAHIDIDSQEVPSSAVDLTNKEKYLQKLHLQERVVEEVKMAIKPFYASKKINKDQYKEILRKAVPKICHSKSGNINPMKIKSLVEAYVEKFTKRSKESPHMEEDSPAPKANGERSKAKTAVR